MVRKPKTIKSMNKVWVNLMEYAKDAKQNEKFISVAFNVMLNGLLGDDFFGTEGQCDPRGDHCDDNRFS